jgi:hypothetical protein
MMDFFKNEAEARTINALNIENRLDRVSLYGSIDITRDVEGLALAVKLKEMLDGMIAVLSAEQAAGALPAQVTLAATDEVENPFG